MTSKDIRTNAMREQRDVPQVIEMKRGIPGFEGVKRYSLKAREEGSPFGVLQALEEGGPTFIVVNPFLACPEYEPTVSDREVRMLGIDSLSEASLLVIVTLRDNPPEVTVNLRAPLVINMEKGLAAQVVLEDDRWSVRHSIMK